MPTEPQTVSVSLIHPDMYNRILRKHGINVEVTEEEGKLTLSYSTEPGEIGDTVAAFVNQLLMYDLHISMVLDSNVGRLKDVVADLKNLEETNGWYDPEEEAEIRTDCIETLEGVVQNLDGQIKSYREETNR